MGALPFEEHAISAYASRAAWDASVFDIVHTMLERWHLTPGSAFVGGEAASVLRVTDATGTPAVLKVGYPHFEAIWEAVGLESLGATLAPELLRQDPWTWAMLLEELTPGDTLAVSGMETCSALGAALDLFEEMITIPAPPGVLRLDLALENYRPAVDAVLSASRAFLDERRVLDIVLAAQSDLPALLATSPGDTFLHGDLNPGNIIRGQRENTESRWFLIDPKPMLGDPAFDLAPLLNQIGNPSGHEKPSAQLWEYALSVERRTGLDPIRIAKWARVRSCLDVAWYLEDAREREVERSLATLRNWDQAVRYAEGTRNA